jgi:hypothetical protein
MDFKAERPAMNRERISNPSLIKEISLQPCVISMKIPCDPCHVTTVRSGGDDTRDNVMPLGHDYHEESHKQGWVFMARTYWPVRLWLLRMGRWDILFKLKMYARTSGLKEQDAATCEKLWDRLEKLHVGAGGDQWGDPNYKAINQTGGTNA